MACLYISDEYVDEMVSVIRMAGVRPTADDVQMRRWVRLKLEDGRVPDFESMKWVKREKNDEVV